MKRRIFFLFLIAVIIFLVNSGLFTKLEKDGLDERTAVNSSIIDLFKAKSTSLDDQEKQKYPFPTDDMPCNEIDPVSVIVPDDFHLKMYQGRSSRDPDASYELELFADGRYTIKKQTGPPGSGESSVQTLIEEQVSIEKVKMVYAKVLGCRFFELNEEYINEDVTGGSIEKLTITATGRTHSVRVRIYLVKRFNSIQIEIIAEIPHAIEYF